MNHHRDVMNREYVPIVQQILVLLIEKLMQVLVYHSSRDSRHMIVELHQVQLLLLLSAAIPCKPICLAALKRASAKR